jgi:PAS domain-containing protein
LSSLCAAFTEHAPLPMATVEGASHIVRYANPAFCRLMDKPMEQLVGKPFCELLPEKDECDACSTRFPHRKARKPHGTGAFQTASRLLVLYDVAGDYG